MRRGASPIAQTTLAEESGMANNTVAHGYLDLLSDLLVLGTSEPWDPARKGRPWIEVKAGHASPFEFDWFIRNFSREKLLVVSSDRFDGSADRGDRRSELLAFLRVEKVKLQVGMRGGTESEDAGLRRIHAGTI